MENITEIELWDKIIKDIPRNRYWNSLPSLIRDDVKMTTFEKSIIKLRDGTLTGGWEDIKHYIFRIGINETIHQLKKKDYEDNFYNRNYSDESFLDNDEFALDTEDGDDTVNEVKKLIEGITNPLTRDIFNLVLDGYKMREIAEKLDIPLVMAKGHYQRGVTKIRNNNKARITTRRRKKVKEIQYRKIIKKVINTETGDIYDNVAIAARENDIKYGTLNHYLNGTRTNKTPLIYYDASNNQETKG